MCNDCKHHNPDITVKQAYMIGFNNGYGIAESNYYENPLMDRDDFISLCIETEQEHFRQFSPFEFYAKAFNDHEQVYNSNIWDKYDSGVHKGILEYLKSV